MSKQEASKSGEAREGHEDEHKVAVGDTKPNGQHEDYWVLSPEETSKGYTRPYRTSYVHKGERPTYPTRPLTEEEHERYDKYGYVCYEEYPEDDAIAGNFWTQARLDSGCGTKTTMSAKISATYARDPKFYGSTFCCGCGDHFAVGQFVWDGTEELVGS